MFADLILVFEVMISGVRTCFFLLENLSLYGQIRNRFSTLGLSTS